MKSIFIAVALSLLTGCPAPQMLINRATGETVTCKAEGIPPMLNRVNCIRDHEAMGWVQTTEQAVDRARLDESKFEKQKAVAKACSEGIAKNPSLQIISSKISLLDTSQQSFSQLTNSSKPTEEEKVAISLLATEIRRCQAEHDKLYADYPLTLTAVNHSSLSAIESLLASLYEGKISYGDFAKMRKQVADNRESAFAQIQEELKKNAADASARAQQIAAQNAIAQAQASQAFSSSMIAGAAWSNAFKPTPVTQRFKTTCTSGALGSSVQTTCY